MSSNNCIVAAHIVHDGKSPTFVVREASMSFLEDIEERDQKEVARYFLEAPFMISVRRDQRSEALVSAHDMDKTERTEYGVREIRVDTTEMGMLRAKVRNLEKALIKEKEGKFSTQGLNEWLQYDPKIRSELLAGCLLAEGELGAFFHALAVFAQERDDQWGRRVQNAAEAALERVSG